MASEITDRHLPNLIADLQLDNYVVDDLTFKTNSAIISDKAKTVKPTITVDFDVKRHRKEPNRFLISMEVDLNKGQKLKEFSQYQLHLHLFGWFRFTEQVNDLTQNKMIHTNGTSILYGIARGIVAQITGTLSPNRYILPTLNLLAVIQDKAKAAQGKQKAVAKS